MVKCDYICSIPINIPIYTQERLGGNVLNISCLFLDNFNLIFLFFHASKMNVSYFHKTVT